MHRIFEQCVTGEIMADRDVLIGKSIAINTRLRASLEKSVKAKQMLDIGWTRDDQEVPKTGEMGLCPNLIPGSRVRALGKLGSWTASFNNGGQFILHGDTTSFFGAASKDGDMRIKGFAGDYLGYSMEGGTIIGEDGAGNDCAHNLLGGTIIVNGNVGARVGSGMKGGIVIVHGDVGRDPGAGMKGGKIIVNGRCPNPANGVSMSALTKKEVSEINSQISNQEYHIPNDALCLQAKEIIQVDNDSDFFSDSDLSNISIVSNNRKSLNSSFPCDTVKLIGKDSPIALPIPMIPFIDDGGLLTDYDSQSQAVKEKLIEQPFLVTKNPRPIDLLLLGSENLSQFTKNHENLSGIIIDFDTIAPLDDESLDGLRVAILSLLGEGKLMISINGLGAISAAHARAGKHQFDSVVARMHDNSGITEAAALPIIGRSIKENLGEGISEPGVILEFPCNANDIAVLCASGLSFAICPPPFEEPEDIAYWLAGISDDLNLILRRIGISSIDNVSRSNLRANDYDTAAVSGLRLAGFERPLPHWFS